MSNHLINVDLQDLALTKLAEVTQKVAFVPQGDPAMMAGDPAAAGGAPPMDPAMGGMPMDPAMGGMPMDPAMGGMPPGAMPPGMDPAAMGGAPPMDPAMMGGMPPADPMAAIQPMIAQAVQEAMAAQGGGGGGSSSGGGASKAKVNVEQELTQIKQMMAKIVDTLGISMSAAEMVGPPEGEEAAGAAPAPPAGGEMPAPSAGSLSPMQPMAPMGGAKMANHQVSGFRYQDNPFDRLNSRASAIMAIRKYAK